MNEALRTNHHLSSPLTGTPRLREPMPGTLLRLPAVLRTTGLSRSTIYRLVAEQRFPRPVQLSARAVAWRHGDVVAWSDARLPTAD